MRYIKSQNVQHLALFTVLGLTFLGLSMVLGFAMSREASRVASLFVVRSNILKKLLYDPVIMAESLPFQQHSNLSKIQSFSYNEHSFERRYSCTWKTSFKTFNSDKKYTYICLSRILNIKQNLRFHGEVGCGLLG